MENDAFHHGDSTLGRVHSKANIRKANLYWLGFLEGALCSGHIENKELPALLAEAKSIADIFENEDAYDLYQDLKYIKEEPSGVHQQVADTIEAQNQKLFSENTLSEKDEINHTLGFCAGVICDGVVLEAEARALLHKLNTVEHVSSSSKFQKLSDILLKCLADNVLTLAEGEEIADWVARLVGDSFADTGLPSFGVSIQPENIIHDESLVQIKEKRFVLTGTLRQAPRHEVIKLIVVNGGQVSSAPSMKVDYIVIATNLSRDWK